MVTKESEIVRTIQRLIVEKSKGATSSQGTEIKKGIDAKHQLSTTLRLVDVLVKHTEIEERETCKERTLTHESEDEMLKVLEVIDEVDTVELEDLQRYPVYSQ